MLHEPQALVLLERLDLLDELLARLLAGLDAAEALLRPAACHEDDLRVLLLLDADARRGAVADALARRLGALRRFLVLAIFMFSCVRT